MRRALVAAVALAACRGGAAPANDVPDASESPQAKAEPAQLANVSLTSSAAPLAADAGPPPVPLRADQALAADAIVKDASGFEMEAVLRAVDPPAAFRGPETSIQAIDQAKKKTEPHLVVDFTATRARIVLASSGFVLPEETELRSRADRYGHVLLLPSAQQYRIAAPGSLRALFDDRRLDVEPLAIAEVRARGDGSRRLGFHTRKVDVVGRAATATFEIAHVPESADGGELVCRTLLDVMNAPPSTPVCGPDDVPVHVEWRWATKGGLAFDAVSLARRADLGAALMAVPPSSAAFTLPALPRVGAEVLVPAGEIAAFRTAPSDVPLPQVPDGAPPPPESGLSLANPTDQLRFVWLDGAPVAWVAPGGHLAMPWLLRGRYGFAWRAFLGDAVDAPITITVPDALTVGGADGGAP